MLRLIKMKEVFENRRARFDYDILETFQAGIVLSGHEAKSVKSGRANLSGSHAIIRDGKASLLNMSIPSFQPENAPADYDPERTKKLLLKKREIKYLTGKLQENLTLVPIKLYCKDNGFLKLELGLGRGKKKHDKRETIKKRETEKEIRRNIKS